MWIALVASFKKIIFSCGVLIYMKIHFRSGSIDSSIILFMQIDSVFIAVI